jgi:serine/threonine protein kinase
MPLSAGTRIGAYEILGPIGAGGMGEVYRATDIRLKRQVALKLLPASTAGDADRLARFQREAEVLAFLNHPNIAQIYGLEEPRESSMPDGLPLSSHALVMELVEGEDLAAIVARGPVPLADTLAIARQIADALDAAHEQGIIHRDLKPANVKVRADGTVKVLDFGLAKALDPVDAGRTGGDPANSPTITSPAMTQIGVILGTAAYMAPEQARGRPVDKRADIWAFGCVLYEMLTGRRPFEGEDITDVLAAVVKIEPDWSRLPADAPPRLRSLVRRCLRKDPRDRLRDIGDARVELVELTDDERDRSAVTPAPVSPPVSWRRRAVWIAALLVVAGVSAAAASWWHRRSPAGETRLDVQTTPTSDMGFALSPNGRQLVFAGTSGSTSALWLRSLDATTARPIPGTEANADFRPFWSPDSRSIGFTADRKLKRLDLSGGAPQIIADLVAQGAAWGADNVMLLGRGTGGLATVPATGGELTVVATPPKDAGYNTPRFLPDGRHFVFFCIGPDAVAGVYLGAVGDGQVTRLIGADALGGYAAPGWLTYIQDGTLLARRLDLRNRVLEGDPVVIADDVWYAASFNNRASGFSASHSGVMAYRTVIQPRRQLIWFDRRGAPLGPIGPADATLTSPVVAPDGRRVAVGRTVQRQMEVWILDALRAVRFTFGATGSTTRFPLWSSDGARVAYTRSGITDGGRFVKSSNGAGTETPVSPTAAPGVSFNGMTDWSEDGRFILADKAPLDIWVIPTDGGQPFPFIDATPYAERLAQFSPDGRWVTYQSNESGRAEIYIRPFPPASGQWPVSTAGGTQPRWSADGREIYWIAPDAKLMAAPVRMVGTTVNVGAPVVLFQTRIYRGGAENPERGQYDVAADGRFLINTVIDDSAPPPITVVQHWRGAGDR